MEMMIGWNSMLLAVQKKFIQPMLVNSILTYYTHYENMTLKITLKNQSNTEN